MNASFIKKIMNSIKLKHNENAENTWMNEWIKGKKQKLYRNNKTEWMNIKEIFFFYYSVYERMT